ncbi:MAG: hypothetical protein Q7U75_16815 [Desulfobacterales bacterium]|nr:hypothetical protein [Desulfobacterales bacterium]
MPFLFDFSRYNLTRRRPNAGPNAVLGGGDFMWALGDEDGPQFGLADATFVEDGNTYTEFLGWRVGDFARVSQAVAAMPDNGLRFDAVLQSPDNAPAGFGWVFQVLAGFGMVETEIFRRSVTRRRKVVSVHIPASEFVGGTLIFQLQFVAV